MMPRKKRKMLFLASIIAILLIIMVVCMILYFTTDMFKSNQTLFAKYVGQNITNIEKMYDEVGTSEYDEELKQNKYTTDTKIKINYTEELGKSTENTRNSINQLNLQIKGQGDETNQYNYQDIYLYNNDKKITEVEYVKTKDVYGIKFSDLFGKFLLIQNDENIKDILKKAGYAEETLDNIPNNIEFNYDLQEIFEFSDEEKQNLQTKYLDIIKTNSAKENFSKQKNQTIQVDGKTIYANAYILTLSKEQMNQIYLKILEEVKKDELILGRIDKVQNLLEKYFKKTTDFRKKFIQNIEDLSTNIIRNNIGMEETKIIVYENYHSTVKTIIQNVDFEITIDSLSLQGEKYIQIEYQDTPNKHTQTLTYKKAKEKMEIGIKIKEDQQIKQYSLVRNEKIEGKKCDKNIIAKYEDNLNRVEATIEQQINIIDVTEEDIIFKEENYINLSELDKEQLKSTIDPILHQANDKLKDITTNEVKVAELWKVLMVVGITKEEPNFEAGITETERHRFNSKFEMLQSESLEQARVLDLITAIKDNLIDIEVLSGTQLKLKLDQFEHKEELYTTLTSFMEQNKNRKYSAKVSYNETTGLVSDLILTILEK
ncbi:MAG: hypothetical protein HFJ33_01025 [Clostridia bacterium]|nr:hypothetical protein [Clostridia bacterium]